MSCFICLYSIFAYLFCLSQIKADLNREEAVLLILAGFVFKWFFSNACAMRPQSQTWFCDICV